MGRLIVTAFFGVYGATLNGSAYGQSFEEALASAYRTSPALESAKASLRAADEGLAAAQGLRRPTIALEANHGYRNFDGEPASYETSRTSNKATLSVSQSLYDFGKSTAEIEGAIATIEKARYGLLATENSELSLAAQAYVDVTRDQNIVELRRSNVNRLENYLEASKARFEVGEYTRTDVAQSASALARGRSDLVTAESNLRSSLTNFTRLTGLQANSLGQAQLKLADPASRDAVVKLALEKNPNLMMSKKTLEAAEKKRDSSQSDVLPRLKLTGSGYRELDDTTEGSRSTVYNAFAVLSVPIYQGGVAEANLRASREAVAKSHYDWLDNYRLFQANAASAYDNWEARKSMISASKEAQAAANLALEGVTQESKLGLRTLLDLLTSEQDKLSADVNLVVAEHDLLVARVQLAALTGNMTAENLGLLVDRFDDTAHTKAVDGKIGGWGEDLSLPEPKIYSAGASQ